MRWMDDLDTGYLSLTIVHFQFWQPFNVTTPIHLLESYSNVIIYAGIRKNKEGAREVFTMEHDFAVTTFTKCKSRG